MRSMHYYIKLAVVCASLGLQVGRGGDAAVGDEAPEEQQRGELLLGRALGVERIGHGRHF